jgi:hypothetical protein
MCTRTSCPQPSRHTWGGTVPSPCPPRGNAPQHDVYTQIATTLKPGVLPQGMTKAQLREALTGNACGEASLVLRVAH